MKASDEDAVRGLYQQMMDGWNRGSGEVFAAPFTEDADFVAFDGTRFKGRDEIARFHGPLLQTHLTAFQNTRVRPIGRDLAGTLIWLLSDWLWKVLCSRQGTNS